MRFQSHSFVGGFQRLIGQGNFFLNPEHFQTRREVGHSFLFGGIGDDFPRGCLISMVSELGAA